MPDDSLTLAVFSDASRCRATGACGWAYSIPRFSDSGPVAA